MRVTQFASTFGVTLRDAGNFQLMIIPSVIVNFETCKNPCRCWKLGVAFAWLFFQIHLETATGNA